jgi:hypothetical protein
MAEFLDFWLSRPTVPNAAPLRAETELFQNRLENSFQTDEAKTVDDLSPVSLRISFPLQGALNCEWVQYPRSSSA